VIGGDFIAQLLLKPTNRQIFLPFGVDGTGKLGYSPRSQNRCEAGFFGTTRSGVRLKQGLIHELDHCWAMKRSRFLCDFSGTPLLLVGMLLDFVHGFLFWNWWSIEMP
jgi:hypothetical protein